jgi:redox-sensitive bicupin YhaK (pirin superfamily)
MGRTKKVFPTGDPTFSVMQSFPSAISAEEADPFLMCDHFGPTPSTGIEQDPDSFPIGWHPHRGMDILTYLTEGVGRHADSLGNRETFATPGMQWISVGSGIEHAEGGGTPAGQMLTGFQIWVNVPSNRKMEDPRYGTEPPENIPTIQSDGSLARVLAGSLGDSVGPFQTVQSVQIIDITVDPLSSFLHTVPSNLNNCILHVHRGAGTVNGVNVEKNDVIHLDATDHTKRGVLLEGGSSSSLSVLLFAGERLNQPIAWHGPFVMTTDDEIRQTIQEYRKGTFLKKRASWDYKKLSSKPN